MSDTPARPGAAAHTIGATLRYPSREATRAEVEATRFDRPARLRRALRHLGIAWGLAVAAVFVPLLHWVLVPSLLLAGPVLFSAAIQQRAKLRRVRGACPACAAAIDTAIEGRARDDVSFRCESCGRALTVVLDDDARATLLA